MNTPFDVNYNYNRSLGTINNANIKETLYIDK